MTAHQFGSDGHGGSQCFVCGGAWSAEREAEAGTCPARTDLEHGGDLRESGHALHCEAAAETGTCEHSAAALGCTCDLCVYA